MIILTSSGFLGDSLDSGKEFRVFVVDESGQITSIVEDKVQRLAVSEEDGLFDTPNILVI